MCKNIWKYVKMCKMHENGKNKSYCEKMYRNV